MIKTHKFFFYFWMFSPLHEAVLLPPLNFPHQFQNSPPISAKKAPEVRGYEMLLNVAVTQTIAYHGPHLKVEPKED